MRHFVTELFVPKAGLCCFPLRSAHVPLADSVPRRLCLAGHLVRCTEVACLLRAPLSTSVAVCCIGASTSVIVNANSPQPALVVFDSTAEG